MNYKTTHYYIGQMADSEKYWVLDDETGEILSENQTLVEAACFAGWLESTNGGHSTITEA